MTQNQQPKPNPTVERIVQVALWIFFLSAMSWGVYEATKQAQPVNPTEETP